MPTVSRKMFSSLLTASLILAYSPPANTALEPYVRHQEPEFLTFEELKTLAEEGPYPDGALEEKLQKFWRTPMINNEAYYRGVRPHGLVHPKLGKHLRVATWNVEKSLRIKRVIQMLTAERAFELMMDLEQAPRGSKRYKTALRQRERLALSDILILQEMDIGVKRSGYINAAEELAKALDMNYAYGAQQLEIDPVTLGLEKITYEDGGVDQESTDYYAADPKRYKGVFGSAVLSRYPIKYAEVFQLKNQAYDWYYGEKPKIGFVEHARRIGTEALFQNQITREMKVGGRIFFRVDLSVPGLSDKTLTIINIHLEIKCLPNARELQMREILSSIKEIKNPVIVAGDFNAASQDISPTSAWRVAARTAKDPQTWVTIGTNAFLPNALVLNSTRFVSNITKNFQNPLARNVPLLAPNALKPLFSAIKDFRFSDGGAFDFRGDPEHSINRKGGDLANSNQRDLKGFKTTFQVRRPIGPWLGKLRLDWFFVKSYLADPLNEDGPDRFAPHYAETLEEMNTSLLVPASDHHPNVVDLPFEEPSVQRK